jgi:hypothetical protein
MECFENEAFANPECWNPSPEFHFEALTRDPAISQQA